MARFVIPKAAVPLAIIATLSLSLLGTSRSSLAQTPAPKKPSPSPKPPSKAKTQVKASKTKKGKAAPVAKPAHPAPKPSPKPKPAPKPLPKPTPVVRVPVPVPAPVVIPAPKPPQPPPPPPVPAGPAAASIGTAYRLSGCEFTVSKVEYTNDALPQVFGAQKPDEGTKYVLFSIHLRNTGNAPVLWTFDRFHPVLRTSASDPSKVIRGTSLLTSSNKRFEQQPLQPGEEKDLHFHFQIPADATVTGLAIGESDGTPQYEYTIGDLK